MIKLNKAAIGLVFGLLTTATVSAQPRFNVPEPIVHINPWAVAEAEISILRGPATGIIKRLLFSLPVDDLDTSNAVGGIPGYQQQSCCALSLQEPGRGNSL